MSPSSPGHHHGPNEQVCPHCQGSGYKGRVGIYEVLRIQEDMATAISKGASTDVIRQLALESGMVTLVPLTPTEEPVWTCKLSVVRCWRPTRPGLVLVTGPTGSASKLDNHTCTNTSSRSKIRSNSCTRATDGRRILGMQTLEHSLGLAAADALGRLMASRDQPPLPHGGWC